MWISKHKLGEIKEFEYLRGFSNGNEKSREEVGSLRIELAS